MENENLTTPDPRDAMIVELEGRLKEQTEKHDFQMKRADEQQQVARDSVSAQTVQQKRLDDLEKTNTQLQVKLKANKSAPTGDVVYLGGVSYPVVTTVRADQTFVEVKRGHVNEGATLVVIDKQH